jgi:hypothetical protein
VRSAETAVRPRPDDSAQRGKRPAGPAAMRARRTCADMVTTRRPHAGLRGGALAGESVVAQRSQGVAGDLELVTGELPGKEERAGAHQNGVPTVRRRKRHRAVAFNGGGVAPVVIDERGEVLQLEGDPGLRRRLSIEGWSSSEGRSPEGAGWR